MRVVLILMDFPKLVFEGVENYLCIFLADFRVSPPGESEIIFRPTLKFRFYCLNRESITELTEKWQ